jgi:glutaredoxin 3
LPVSARVEIYTTDWCGYCTRAKRLLESKGVEVIEYPAGADPEKRREMVQRSHGGNTFPQVFINDRHVGGSDDIHDLDRAGRLDPLLGRDDGRSCPDQAKVQPSKGRD